MGTHSCPKHYYTVIIHWTDGHFHMYKWLTIQVWSKFCIALFKETQSALYETIKESKIRYNKLLQLLPLEIIICHVIVLVFIYLCFFSFTFLHVVALYSTLPQSALVYTAYESRQPWLCLIRLTWYRLGKISRLLSVLSFVNILCRDWLDSCLTKGFCPVFPYNPGKTSFLTGGTAAVHGSTSGAASSRPVGATAGHWVSPDEAVLSPGDVPLSSLSTDEAMASSAVVAAAGDKLSSIWQRGWVIVWALQCYMTDLNLYRKIADSNWLYTTL